MPKKRKINHHQRRIIRHRSFFILTRWILFSTIFILIILEIITKGEILSIAGIFIKPTPTPTPEVKLPVSISKNMTQEDYVNLALLDLSRKYNLGIGFIEIVEVTAKNWPNTSLNCPEEGKVYAQMIVPGYLIILKASGRTYYYHGGLDQVVSCKTG